MNILKDNFLVHPTVFAVDCKGALVGSKFFDPGFVRVETTQIEDGWIDLGQMGKMRKYKTIETKTHESKGMEANVKLDFIINSLKSAIASAACQKR